LHFFLTLLEQQTLSLPNSEQEHWRKFAVWMRKEKDQILEINPDKVVTLIEAAERAIVEQE
jgi:hypothetical protein